MGEMHCLLVPCCMHAIPDAYLRHWSLASLASPSRSLICHSGHTLLVIWHCTIGQLFVQQSRWTIWHHTGLLLSPGGPRANGVIST